MWKTSPKEYSINCVEKVCFELKNNLIFIDDEDIVEGVR